MDSQEMQDKSISQSMYFDQGQLQDFVQITSTPIQKIISYNVSLHRQKTIITTAYGFCVINNLTKKFKKYECAQNPFHPLNPNNQDPTKIITQQQLQNLQKSQQYGISIGSILQQRTQVAIVPLKTTKTFCNTTVYIYDYILQTILYSNSFFLPIRQLSLTDQSILVSNNKRIIIYNYTQDTKNKDQKYYLNLYANNQQENQHIRYLQMFCQDKFNNNSIGNNDYQYDGQEIEHIGYMQGSSGGGGGSGRRYCKCGEYVLTPDKPNKLVYCRVYTINGVKRISLVIYDFAIDKEYVFDSMEYCEEFVFSVSDDGKYLAYSENQGRVIKIHQISPPKPHQTFHVSRSIKPVCSSAFLKTTINNQLWFTIIRKDGNNNAHMHIFKISQQPCQQPKQSMYKRYFGLYEKTFKDYGISANGIIGPDLYMHNDVLYSFSLAGIVHDVIDFKRNGNHEKKVVQNFVKWSQEEGY